MRRSILNSFRILTIFFASLAGISVGVVSTANVSALSGSEFKAGEIISDAHFFDGGALSETEVQAFLNAKVPNCRAGYTCLKSYQQNTATKPADAYCGRYEGGAKTSARIIIDVARACGVSPKVILVLLQKEQTLVTDTWPEAIQYRSATGYGCPDSAACDSEYYGFFNQVYQAARQYKVYAGNKNSYNYRALRNNNIYFQADNRNTPQNEQIACGYTSVFINNQATAGLYIYTPYQPNKAALDNLYGLGDSCSAYGNRNFWRLFNDWFGTSQSESFMRVISDNPDDKRQWVIYSGVKQYLPDPSIIYAWGLEDTPLTTLPASQIAATTTGPDLGRVMKNKGGNYLYLVDSGKRFRVATSSLVDIWGVGDQTVSIVAAGLFTTPADGGDLKPYIKQEQSNAVYMVDGKAGGQIRIRLYANVDVFLALEGTEAVAQTVSSALFGAMSIDTPIAGTKVSYGGTTYQLYDGRRLWQKDSISTIYGGPSSSMTLASLSRFDVGQNATQLIQSSTSPVYLLDNGVRYPISSPEILNSWIIGSDQVITRVNNNFLNLIPHGSVHSSYLGAYGGQTYLINQAKLPIANNYVQRYSSLGSPFQMSQQLYDLYKQGRSISLYIRSSDSKAVYFIDGDGNMRHVSDSAIYDQAQYNAPEVSYYIAQSMPEQAAFQKLVTSGNNLILLDQGNKWSITNEVVSEWNLRNPQPVSNEAISSFVTSGVIENKVKDKDGVYYLISGKKAYATVDERIAGLWGIHQGVPTISSLLPYKLMPVDMLTRFAKSSNGKVYMIDQGNWYGISPTPLANLGGDGHPFTYLEPSNAPNSITEWDNFIVKNSTGKVYVIDSGKKRLVPAGSVYDTWTQNGSITPKVVSDSFLNLFTEAPSITRSIKGAGPGIFTIVDGKKRLLNSNEVSIYAPYTTVSEALINSIPNS